MIAGAVYGVALNDRQQLAALGEALSQPPYARPPAAPVLYIKPRTCLSGFGAAVPLPPELSEVEAAPTLGLLLADDAGAIGAACLALDVCEPHASYYRPAIRQRCRDGFLPLGGFAPFDAALAGAPIVTRIDGALVHRWELTRLVRGVAQLLADIGGFMTLQAGDLLLVGLPGDAPRARAGQSLSVEMDGLPTLHTRFEPEAAA
jgi:5-oxopent-3-ene-1,2,5-tricarboxylate decarboxylase/2-hydroxyhepta-2,4-diene-1,7-dioate isomerase